MSDTKMRERNCTSELNTAESYTQVITSGNRLTVYGLLPLAPGAAGFVTGTMEDCARQALLNLQQIVKDAGSSMEKVLKLTSYMLDLKDFVSVNSVYGEFFHRPFPVRNVFSVPRLPMGRCLEMEAVVELPQGFAN